MGLPRLLLSRCCVDWRRYLRERDRSLTLDLRSQDRPCLDRWRRHRGWRTPRPGRRWLHGAASARPCHCVCMLRDFESGRILTSRFDCCVESPIPSTTSNKQMQNARVLPLVFLQHRLARRDQRPRGRCQQEPARAHQHWVPCEEGKRLQASIMPVMEWALVWVHVTRRRLDSANNQTCD